MAAILMAHMDHNLKPFIKYTFLLRTASAKDMEISQGLPLSNDPMTYSRSSGPQFKRRTVISGESDKAGIDGLVQERRNSSALAME